MRICVESSKPSKQRWTDRADPLVEMAIPMRATSKPMNFERCPMTDPLPSRSEREQTDESLRLERDKATVRSTTSSPRLMKRRMPSSAARERVPTRCWPAPVRRPTRPRSTISQPTG
jgi:hypothetical protein